MDTTNAKYRRNDQWAHEGDRKRTHEVRPGHVCTRVECTQGEGSLTPSDQARTRAGEDGTRKKTVSNGETGRTISEMKGKGRLSNKKTEETVEAKPGRRFERKQQRREKKRKRNRRLRFGDRRESR